MGSLRETMKKANNISEKDNHKDNKLSKEYLKARQKAAFPKASQPGKSGFSNEFFKDENVEEKTLQDNNVSKSSLQLVARKLLIPNTQIKDNFAEMPVIDPLINFSFDKDKENIDDIRKNFNWLIFGDFRHVNNSNLSNGNRITIRFPKYLITAINVVTESINNADDVTPVKQIIKDLDIKTNGKLINIGEDIKPLEYKKYNASVRANNTWIVLSLLLGTIKIGNKLREKIIDRIAQNYPDYDDEIKFMLKNNVITPENFVDKNKNIYMLESKDIIKWYNLSLLNTSQRIFNNSNSENMNAALDNDYNVQRKLNDGVVSRMINMLSSSKIVISDLLHYTFFIE
ncbi:hypothetical protein [Apilactobacillus timberlakei]|uniref:hypothetical protein n=1 Tax=Apilactobacillus timberlakei TaxID=2008380 RepID=UPI0011274DBC|nr:hypothetical protein [Apilactobacillus timberlakei]TPR16730.1 hypothetical protein DYZ95_07050 [Apilactobacillus timberlakei]TPR21592.1 hypothetical protein DY083_06100 [Apilactobacillus timberlakei]